MRYVEIDPDNAGRRLDNFLASELPRVPRSRLYRLLRKGEVRVNGGRARAERRLRAGETVRLPPVDSLRGRSPERGPLPARRLEGTIVYEDDGLLVVNKPSGLAVHGGSGESFGVIQLLRAARPDAPYLELVHRLDRETSGCLVVAKRRRTLLLLHDALRNRRLEKRYVALLGGSVSNPRQRVHLALARPRMRGGERVVRVSQEGRDSVTDLAVLARGHGVTLTEVSPKTGRTHQIRVHCAAIGHPVAGDTKYGDAAFNRRLRSSGLHRLYLHAASVRLKTPEGRIVRVSAPLDSKLATVARELGVPESVLGRLRFG